MIQNGGSSVDEVKICSWPPSSGYTSKHFRVSKGTVRGMSDSFGECYISFKRLVFLLTAWIKKERKKERKKEEE